MGLRTQVVDLVWLRLLNNAGQVAGVGQIPVMQFEPLTALVRILIDVIDALGIKGRGATLDAVDLIALLQEEFR